MQGHIPTRLGGIFRSPCYENSPNRVSERSGYDYSTGRSLWTTRPWRKGERAHYCRNVLGREPYASES